MDKLVEYLSLLNSKKENGRVTWREYFKAITHLVASRSTCLRRKVGAIAIDQDTHRILATGYNGAPSGLSHCTPESCYKTVNNIATKDGLGAPCKALHAEQNLILQAATTNISLKGAVIYCTHQPCSTCTKLLIGCKVKAVYYFNPYPDEYAQTLWNEYKWDCCVQI